MRKARVFTLTVITMTLILSMAIIACGGGTVESRDDLSWEGILSGHGPEDGKKAEIIITPSKVFLSPYPGGHHFKGREVLTPISGDEYHLRFIDNGGTISRGKIEVNDFDLTFIPNGGGNHFTGRYSGGDFIISSIPFGGYLYFFGPFHGDYIPPKAAIN